MPSQTLPEQLPAEDSFPTECSFNPARQAFLNGCVNFSKGLLTVAVTVALTPFLVSHLGVTRFGVWSLLGLFITYVALIDFGISGATAKFIGELSRGEEDVQRMSRVFATAMASTATIACSAVILVSMLRHSLETQLARFGLFGEDAKLFLIGMVALYSVGVISNGLFYVLLGLHRLDVGNYIAASVLLVQGLGTVVVLRAGFGLLGLISLVAGSSALSIAAYFTAARKLVPGMRFHWRDFSFTTTKELISFGIFLQAYALVGVYYFYVGKAVVSLRLPLAAVASYEVALRLPILFRQGVITMLGPMMPAVSHLDARGKTQEIKSLLLKAMRYSLILGAPAFIGMAVFADPLIRLWVGPAFENSVVPLRILSIAFGLGVFPELVWFFLVGLGRQRLAIILSLVQVATGTLLSYVLADRWGLAGVALGALFTSLLGALLYAGLLVRERILSFSDLPVTLALRVIATASLAFMIVFGLLQKFRLTHWNFALAVFLASAAYFLCIVRGNVLENRERLFVRGFVPSYLHFLC
jgi:O-antigen/teichoic acid export membrane protein